MRTVYRDHQRFVQTYFSTYPGTYFTGDGSRRDEDGYYWITGRVDDVINVAGHRMGTAEVESALVAHPKVAEAACVGYPHSLKGQGIYVYVTLMSGIEPTEELRTELKNWVRTEIGPIATPDLIQFAPGLAQDALRQNHAPDLAQDRRGRFLQPRRHIHARRAWRRDRLDRQPHEQARLLSHRRPAFAGRHIPAACLTGSLSGIEQAVTLDKFSQFS